MSKIWDLSDKEYDYIIYSATDHYGGLDAHGTTQMFKYMKNDLGLSCALLLTKEKMFDLEDSYLISDFLDNDCTSAATFRVSDNIEKMLKIFNESIERFDLNADFGYENLLKYRNYYGEDEFNKILTYIDMENTNKDPYPRDSRISASFLIKEMLYYENAIKRLPKHKAVIYASKLDGGGGIYSFINISQKFHDAKIIYYCMVHNAYTGGCSYPSWNNCDKYKYEEGCYNCAFQANHNKEQIVNLVKQKRLLNQPYHFGMRLQQMQFDQMKQISKKFSDKIIYLASSQFSFDQAKESYLFKNAEVKMARLKTLKSDRNRISNIIQEKSRLRKKFIQETGLYEKYCKYVGISAEDLNIIFWSCMDAKQERKGIKEFIDICHLLAKRINKHDLKKYIIVFGGDKYALQDYLPALPPTMTYLTTGITTNEKSLEIFGASDLYCCTTLEDGGPRTVSESLYAGTPVVSFDRCIAKDILNGKNGHCIETPNTRDFCDSIIEYFNKSKEERRQMCVDSITSFVDFYDEEKMKNQWIKSLEL